jgi:outer membrane protein assembly factor BamB
MRCQIRRIVAVCFGLVGVTSFSLAEWSQFLGPQRNGVSAEKGINLDWKKNPPKELWRKPLGSGYSSMSFAGDKVFTQTQRGQRQFVVCFDAEKGTELWATDICPSYVDVQGQGPGPRGTPTFADGKLYCLFPNGELVCVDADKGKLLWQKDIFKESGARNPAGETYYWGMSGSPLVEGNLVIVQPGGNKNNSLVAFDKTNGKLVWGVGSDPAGYGSPIVITVAGQRMIVGITGQGVLGADPAGKLLWRYEFGNKYDCNCATPVWHNGLLFLSAAYATGAAAIEIVKEGDKFVAKEKWRNKSMENQFATSIVLDGHAYGTHGTFGGYNLRCVELKTGEIKWMNRATGKSSFIAVEGHLIAWTEDGTLRLVQVNPKEATVKGELSGLLKPRTWAPPALHNGRLYLRDGTSLLCLDLRGK